MVRFYGDKAKADAVYAYVILQNQRSVLTVSQRL